MRADENEQNVSLQHLQENFKSIFGFYDRIDSVFLEKQCRFSEQRIKRITIYFDVSFLALISL
jgi:hypothetical protein